MRPVPIILDNYARHESAVVSHIMRTVGSKLGSHLLPPHCPDDNEIGRIGEDVQAHMGGRFHLFVE